METLSQLLNSFQTSGPEPGLEREVKSRLISSLSGFSHSDGLIGLSILDCYTAMSIYNEQVFKSLLVREASPDHLKIILSKRMTRNAGSTIRSIIRANGLNSIARYELKISLPIIFGSSTSIENPFYVSGIKCTSSLDVFQRIIEHEIIHLCEWAAWNKSDCSNSRFRAIAKSLFNHTESSHNVDTRSRSGPSIGSSVEYFCDGKKRTGIVNRVNKRITVLEADPNGVLYSNGVTYRKRLIKKSDLIT